jgi:hypothetical protein
MNEGAPILEGQPLSDEHKRLVALFDELEKKQLEFLDQAGKRVIELSTGLLGVLFAVTAFGDKFPPPYLEDNNAAQGLAVATLALYLGAMFMGVWTVQPRKYKRYLDNLSEMKKVLEQIIAHKSRSLQVAGALFWLGSLTLALLIASIILAA